MEGGDLLKHAQGFAQTVFQLRSAAKGRWCTDPRGGSSQCCKEVMRRWILTVLLAQAAAVKELFTAKEFKDLLQEANGRPIVLDFYSMSCGPCHMIAPVFRKISKDFAGKAYFRKVDVAKNQQLASQQGIRSMPTFQFWLRGKKRHQFSGADE
eukprot:Skav213444  [mRNA]  locus=scaffold837:224919:238263:- [translate_table: standard]